MLQHDDVSSDGQDEVKKWKKQLLLEKREISRVENSYKVLIISMTWENKIWMTCEHLARVREVMKELEERKEKFGYSLKGETKGDKESVWSVYNFRDTRVHDSK